MLAAVRRQGPLVLAFVACTLLIVSEFTTRYSIRVITVTAVGSHHGYALLVIALVTAAMAVGAARGRSRPPAFALLALAATALLVVLAIDLPVVDDVGIYGRYFEQARAQAGIGLKLATAGAILLLLAAVTILAGGPGRDAPVLRRSMRGDRRLV